MRSCVRVLMLLIAAACSVGAATSQIQFNRDVRPILSDNCYACHGPDKNQRKAKLRLDVREVALEKEAIIPGKPAESKLVRHIFATDPEEIMPPPKTQKTLAPAQKELLKRWIAEGAEYEPHWAYIPPRRFPIPQVKNTSWVRSPIDAFILRALEARNIRPSPEADKRTLLRRVSLDLVGLPPTSEEVKTFLADKRSDAYERQVERLLNSPHFGERMAVPWLDVVRFADTVGYHGDQNQNIFPYRDYVIDAFNRNKPFDQFTIEQIAGDLLPNPSVEAQVATGFNRLNMMTREGGAQPKEYLAKYAADRVRTVSMAWLGSTMGCAECHDHKFDPFSTKDFYSMEAFFADLKQWGVYENYGYTPEPELEGIDNDGPFPPEIELDTGYLRQRLLTLQARAERVYAGTTERLAEQKQRDSFALWCKSSLSFLQQWPDGWASPEPQLVALQLKDTNAQTNFSVGPDGTVGLSNLPRESLKITLPLSNMWLAAIRLEILVPETARDQPAAPKYRRGARVMLSASLKSTGDETKLSFYDAEADHKQERFANGRTVLGVKDSWQLSPDHEKQFAVWVLNKPVQVNNGDLLIINPGNAAVRSVRVSVSPFPAEDPIESGATAILRKALEKGLSKRSPERQQLIGRTYLLGTHWDGESAAQARQLIREMRLCSHGHALTMVSAARPQPAVTRVLPRGNFLDENGEVVQPAAPHFLPQISDPEGRRLTRLDLARWLVSSDNPLTARAVVNRFWKQFFGAGLSAVLDDLGVQGEWPVHPELLDWLACEFMNPVTGTASGHASRMNPESFRGTHHSWDVKHIVKLMVMSSTYRQQSNLRPDLQEIDANNRLLAFEPPRRLEAEFVRDNALFIAGLLNLDIGGPSAHPYQPAGYYANIQFPDRDYYPEKDERQYRRGIYAHWQRTFLHPMLANFDAPAREECTAIRVVSNTPQQALTLLNDPSFVEAARVFAAQVLAPAKKSDEQRLDAAFERALARPVSAKEKESLLKCLSVQRDHYQKDGDETAKLMKVGIAPVPKNLDPAEVAAWTQVCRVILNLQETVTRY